MQRVCIHLNRDSLLTGTETALSSHVLRWSIDDETGDVAALTQQGSVPADVVVAADCLFFKDFHQALLCTLLRLLKPRGVAILLQPPRGGTMSKFLDNFASEHFDIELLEDYCPQV